MVILLIGPFLANLDFFITNVALPTIDRDLGASSGALELVVAGYGTAYAVLLVVGGRLGDMAGRRRVFAWGLIGFTATSLLAGLAPTIDTLILARIAQGASAALVTPQVLATFQTILAGATRARAISLYAAAGGLSAVLGQLLGGLVLELDVAGTAWRGIFLLNVPVGIVAVALLRRTVPETRSASPAGFDLAGTALLALTIVSLLVPLTEGGALGWPWWTWPSLAVAASAAAGFVLVERRGERAGRVPLLPPSMIRLASMRRGLPVTGLHFVGFGGFMFVFALATQDGLHLGALQSGVALTPLTVAYFATSFGVPRLLVRYGRTVLTIATGLSAAGLTALTVPVVLSWPHVSLPQAAPGLVLLGGGQALGVGAIFRLVLSDVPPALAGVASGAMITAQQAALALGVASLGTLFSTLSPQGFALASAVTAGVYVALTTGIGVVSRRLPQPGG